MKSARFLFAAAGAGAVYLAPLGIVSAAFSMGFVAVIHRALHSDESPRDLALAFIGFGVGRILAAYFSGMLLGNQAQEAITELRRKLIGRVLTVPYRQVERFGAARVHAALTYDVATLESALESVPNVVISAAVLIGGVAYLAFLSPLMLLALGALALPCAAVFYFVSRRARRSLALQRDAQDRLSAHLHALTEGTKELKLHVPRRRSFLNEAVLEATEAMLEHEIEGRSRLLLGQAINQLLVLVLLGAVLFAFPFATEARSELTSGYVLAALYLLGPLTALAQLVPMFHAAEIALARIEELGVRLGEEEQEPEADPDAIVGVTRIELRALRYHYDDLRAFSLGPIELAIEPGELLFVTGGNGSGKSTLARVLTGLYAANSGELVWDGEAVTRAHRDRYRQLWSAVFADLHLFDRLYGLSDAHTEQRAKALLTRLGLDEIVRIEDGSISPLDLSSGQRKRLALCIALLEDRPMMLFDEWAADQDPEFREVFYREILPALRDQGKGVVVVTHDDRYFDVADRLVHLHEGKIVRHR